MPYQKTFMDAASVQFADSNDFADTAKVSVNRNPVSVGGSKVYTARSVVSLSRDYLFPVKEECCDPAKRVSTAASLMISTPLDSNGHFRNQLLLDVIYVTLATYGQTSKGFVPYEVALSKPATVAQIKELLDGITVE